MLECSCILLWKSCSRMIFEVKSSVVASLNLGMFLFPAYMLKDSCWHCLIGNMSSRNNSDISSRLLQNIVNRKPTNKFDLVCYCGLKVKWYLIAQCPWICECPFDFIRQVHACWQGVYSTKAPVTLGLTTTYNRIRPRKTSKSWVIAASLLDRSWVVARGR